MKTTPHPRRSLPMRRLVATIAVASAGAAVAGAVVLAERPARADATAMRAAAATTHSPKDAWRRAPTPWLHDGAGAAVAPIDVSLPSAAEALAGAAEPGDDAAPSF